MGMKEWAEKAKKTRDRLHLGPRHAMERFAVVSGLLAATGMVIVPAAGVVSMRGDNAQFESVPAYTSDFISSRTAIEGEVVGVYRNQDSTRSLVLLRFADPSSVSTAAENYQAFVAATGAKGPQDELRQEATQEGLQGRIHSFGSTGYLGVELDNAKGLEKQILMVMMRSNAELQEVNAAEVEDNAMAQTNESYKKYDQWPMLINPGATGVEHLKSMDHLAANGELDLQAIYDEAVLSQEEQKLRTEMVQQVGDLRTALNKVEEYSRRVEQNTIEGVSMKAPKTPALLAGDTFTCDHPEVKSDQLSQCPAESLRYDPKWVYPNGYDFEWQDRTIGDGYLKQVVPKDQKNVLRYLTTHAEAVGSAKDQKIAKLNPADITWKLEDGSDLADYNPDLPPVAAALAETQQLARGWESYASLKEDYQTQQLPALLNLEVSLRDVSDNSTTNSQTDAVVVK